MGKSSSKLKKRRTQSVAWSFRFKQPTTVSNDDQPDAEVKGRRFRKRHQKIEELQVDNNMTPVIICSGPHLDIQEWLKRLDLERYKDKFDKFYGVEELIYYTEGDIHKLGVKNAADRARMVSSLVALRSKRDKQNNNNNNVGAENKFQQMRNQRHSLAPEIARQKDHQERDSIYEVLAVKSTTKTSKSVGDLLEMEPTTPDPEQAALKKALEWELSLDSRDIRSCAWYHGPIPRHRAEEIVEKEGDFLIRDCTSQPGNYVLTCRNVAKGPVLHFVISKLILQPDTVYERVQFQLEDDPFDTISDLVTYYVGSGKPISAASGARIQTPCNRLYPLSYYTAKYDRGSSIRGPSPMSSSASVNQMSTYRSPMSSPPPRTKRDVPPRLPSKKQRSQSLTPLQPSSVQNMVAGRAINASQEKYCSADGVIQGNEGQASSTNKMTKSEQQKLSTQSLSRTISAQAIRTYRLHSRTSSLSRDYSDSSLSPCLENRQFGENEENNAPSPPPKPTRTSSLTRNGDGEKSGDAARANGDPAYRASGSDSGNGSGDSAQSSAAGEESTIPLRSGVIIRNPRYLQNSASSVTLRSYADFDPEAVEKALLALQPIVYKNESTFDLDTFQTVLLPFVEHKPLDSSSLNTIRMMLCENGSLIIATHLTKVDIKMILGDDVIETSTPKTEEKDSRKYSGLELITLDEGSAFRLDLIERTQCLKLLVATTILTCTDDIERAETINKWIQIANDTKTALGNLFGFSAIMLGLSMPQVQNLDNTWHILRQKFTESAFNFEAKLRPTLKSMNDCSNPQAPNTTIPHLLPYILLKDRKLQDITGPNVSQLPSLVNCCINSWETTAEDFGITTMFAHLDSARTFINNLPLYKKNAQIAMSDTSRADALLEEVFRTEFHIKFLWGSKGSFVTAIDRHTKFEQVLSAMADKFCSNNTQEN